MVRGIAGWYDRYRAGVQAMKAISVQTDKVMIATMLTRVAIYFELGTDIRFWPHVIAGFSTAADVIRGMRLWASRPAQLSTKRRR